MMFIGNQSAWQGPSVILPSRVSGTPFSWLLSANLMSLQSIPLSTLLIKLLNSISSSTGSWETPPITWTLSHWLLLFGCSLQQSFYPSDGPSTKSIFSQCNNKTVMGHHTKGLREVWVDGIQALPLFSGVVAPSQKAMGLIKHDLCLVMPCRLLLILSYMYFDIYFRIIFSITCFTILSMMTEEFSTAFRFDILLLEG